MQILIFTVLTLLLILLETCHDRETRRKKRGLDQYRIKVIETYELGEVVSKRYYVEQRLKSLTILRIFIGDYKPWVELQEYSCGMGDCYWNTVYFSKLEDAEKAIEKIRIENSTFNGTKEEIIKYIP